MRHPGYAGAWLSNLGTILAFGCAATLVSAVLMALATHARVAREETVLKRVFGDEYRSYRSRVGRWG